MQGHHISIRTADIHRAIAFYETLDFEVETRFTAGITLACWMTGPAGRLELIQIPEPHPPPDAFHDEHYVGYYHLALDVSESLTSSQTLEDWIRQFAQKIHEKSLCFKVLLMPQQQQFGDRTYEVAFITDSDGLPLELLRQLP